MVLSVSLFVVLIVTVTGGKSAPSTEQMLQSEKALYRKMEDGGHRVLRRVLKIDC